MMNRRKVVAALALAGMALSAPALAQQAATDTLEISNGFTRASPGMAMSGAAFLTIRSLGPADRLIGFRSPVCNRPELHTHIDDNGVMRMRQVEAIEVPAGGEAVLEPGGLHLMLIDLTEQLVEGENVALTLVFESAGEVDVSVPVKKFGAMH